MPASALLQRYAIDPLAWSTQVSVYCGQASNLRKCSEIHHRSPTFLADEDRRIVLVAAERHFLAHSERGNIVLDDAEHTSVEIPKPIEIRRLQREALRARRRTFTIRKARALTSRRHCSQVDHAWEWMQPTLAERRLDSPPLKLKRPQLITLPKLRSLAPSELRRQNFGRESIHAGF